MQVEKRNPNFFPWGRIPRIPTSHIALARNGALRFAAVATNSGASMVGLYPSVQRGTVSGGGTYGSGTDGYMGSVATQSGTNATSGMTFSGISTVNDTIITFGIVMMQTTAGTPTFQYPICMNNTGGSAGWCIQMSTATVQVGMFSGTSASSGVALTANVPYFIAISATTGTNNFVIKNLNTGVIRTANPTTAQTPAAPNGTVVMFCAATSTTNTFIGKIAAAAAIGGSLLSLQELTAWADDPWSFWYPTDQDEQFADLSAIDIQSKVWDKPSDTALEIVGY